MSKSIPQVLFCLTFPALCLALETGLTHAKTATLDGMSWHSGQNPPLINRVTNEINPQRLDFFTYINTVLALSPQIRKSTAEVAQRHAQLGIVNASAYPSVSSSIARTRENTKNSTLPPSELLSTQKNIQFSWQIADFGSQRANTAAATQALTASLLREFASTQSVLLSSVRLYFVAQSHQAEVSSAQFAVRMTERSLSAVQTRQRNGLASPSDVMQAQAAYLQSILAREKALTDLQTSMSELMRSVQWDPRGVTPVLDEHSQIDNLQFEEEMMEEEIRRHPAVVAAQSELLESKARIQAARAELLPTLVFAGGRFLGGEPGRALALLPSQTTRLNLTLQIPIFDGFGKDYKVREAQATSASRQSDLEITVNNVANELWKSYYSLSQLLRTYPILKDVVQTKHELFLSSEKRYAAGVEDILDLLNLQKEYISAATQLTQTQLSIRIARANFLTGLGRFSLSGY